jgi:membrane-bound lytic murein transglycosylase A
MRFSPRLAVAALLALFAAGCTGRHEPVPDEPEAPAMLIFEPAAFSQMSGWIVDDHAAALSTFLRSCEAIENKAPDAPMGGNAAMGTAGAWQEVCRTARNTALWEAQGFFETWFRPWRATNAGEGMGLFTGYYEPLLRGSWLPDETYHYPLYRMPAAVVVDGIEQPLPDRAEIDDGALADQGLELLWVDDPIAAFFLHIQGSGRVVLPDGSEVRVGYAGQNGHVYYAIGRELVALEELTREEVSLQSIRAWLHENPDRTFDIMATNPSYIFFDQVDGEGPIGAQGVPLTPGRSLAVDRAFYALGVPVWLATKLPDDQPWRRLMVTQDTGGAIKGPVRGDIFFGGGDWAEWNAGHMKGQGAIWVLLPHLLTSDLLASLEP